MTFFCNFDWNFVIEFVHVFFRSHRIFCRFQQLKVIDDVKNERVFGRYFFSDRKRHTNSEILFFLTSFLLAVVLKCIPHMFPCWFIFFEVSKLSKFFLSIIPSGPEASIRLLFCKNFLLWCLVVAKNMLILRVLANFQELIHLDIKAMRVICNPNP